MVVALRAPASAPFRVPIAPAAVRETRRQRAKLWELNPSVHCSVIGTCLTTAELRTAMGKVLRQDVSGISDHDLHSRAVSLCERQGDPARMLHKTLDRRHELAIKRFSRLSGEEAVLEAWTEARRAGDIPGCYWAVLTHPDTGHGAMRKAFGDVHMLSHLVGAANRADIRRLTALEEENAALRAKVERQQTRLQQEIAARDETIRRLGTLAVAQIGAEPAAPDEDALAGLRHLVTDLQSRLERANDRRDRFEQRASDAAESARADQARTSAAEARANAMERELAALERQDDLGPTSATLAPQRILYVGGRPSAILRMRDLLDGAGGALLTHDGGRHDHPSLLPGLIGQADMAVFPVDCVSHDAALTIKRLCRQQSKPWVPLRTSGLGSFLAALTEPSSPTEECP